MGFRRTQAPGDLDADGVRKYTEEQLLRIQRATAEMDKESSEQITALQNADIDLSARIAALELLGGGQCKFVYVNATTCRLVPFNGNKIKVNERLYDIPAAGIDFPNSGLVANTIHFAYVGVSGGNLIGMWGTGGPGWSSTPGNEGVMIHATEGDAWSFVGVAYTNATSEFSDNQTNRLVRSWFNEAGVMGYAGANGSIVTTPVSVWYEPDTSLRISVLLFPYEHYAARLAGSVYHNTVGAISYFGIIQNGAIFGNYGYVMHGTSGYWYTYGTLLNLENGNGYSFMTFSYGAHNSHTNRVDGSRNLDVSTLRRRIS